MFSHDLLRGLQGGLHTREANEDTANEYFHLTSAEHAALQAGTTVGEFNVSLGVESIVEDAGVTSSSKIFLMAQNADAAALATAGLSVAAGVGSFTATHGSAEASAGKFSYLFV